MHSNSATQRKPTTPPAAGATSKAKTRASTTHGALHSDKTRAELYDLSESKINWLQCDYTTARDHLYAGGFLLEKPENLPDLGYLALALLRIAADSSSKVVADACRAMAVILEITEGQADLGEVAGNVRTILGLLENRDDTATVDDVEDTHNLRSAAVMLTNTVHQQCEDINSLTTRMEDTVTDLIRRVQTLEKNTTPQPISSTSTVGPTYASVAASTMPAPTREHAAFLARAELRDRQILLEKTPGTETWMDGLSEKEVMEKASLALGLMEGTDAEDGDRPTEIRCIGATMNKNSSMLLYFNSKLATNWVKKHMASFLGSFAGTCAYKERSYNVFVEYVPVSLDFGREGALHTVEMDNNYPQGVISKARWIKPVERRNAGQKFAHAVLGFSDPHIANECLKHGMWVEGKHVYARKLLSEPTRCMKCQEIGTNHTAATCRSIHDTCARCAGFHRTTDCEEPNDKRACANCKNARREHEGHGAADRACPIFLDKLQVALERNPDAKYPYFPVAGDATSWITHEEEGAKDRESRGGRHDWQTIMLTRRRGPGPAPKVAAGIRNDMTGRSGTRIFGGERANLDKGSTGAHEGWRDPQLTIPEMMQRSQARDIINGFTSRSQNTPNSS